MLRAEQCVLPGSALPGSAKWRLSCVMELFGCCAGRPCSCSFEPVVQSLGLQHSMELWPSVESWPADAHQDGALAQGEFSRVMSIAKLSAHLLPSASTCQPLQAAPHSGFQLLFNKLGSCVACMPTRFFNVPANLLRCTEKNAGNNCLLPSHVHALLWPRLRPQP